MADSQRLDDKDFDKVLMREFYRSGASNYAAFKKAKLSQSTGTPKSTDATRSLDASAIPSRDATAPLPSVAPAAAAAAAAPKAKTTNVASLPSPIPQPNVAAKPAPAHQAAPVAAPPAAVPAAALSPSPSPVPATQPKAVAQLTNSINASNIINNKSFKDSPVGGQNSSVEASASVEYMAFLKQNQDLQKCHHKLDELLNQYEKDRTECNTNLDKVRSMAVTLLSELEQGSNWNLISKYTVQTLIKDAKLELQPRELYQPDDKPKYLDIVQQQGNLDKLKKDNMKREPFQDFRILFENAAKRLERAEKEVKGSQLDAQTFARLPDTLFIQLDHILSSPTITEILEDIENRLEDLMYKLEDTKAKREQAMEDGEMPRAEEYCNDEIRYLEGILELVIDKIRTTARTKNESQVFDKVREQYHKKSMEDMLQIKGEKEVLKKRCEEDMRRIFTLKERVDAVEAQTVLKLEQEHQQSEVLLADNQTKTDKCWQDIRTIEEQLRSLEQERYQEVKKRIATKEKDETRKMEYERFSSVVQKHTSLLDLTVKNCETAIHVITLLGELVATGFTTLGNYLNKCDNKYSDLQLQSHQQHLEFFQGLYLSLGELIHKKEKRIEEIDRDIQTNHIQHELAIDTLNPTAKKYSDAKKQLLMQRDAVERELRELREKAQGALSNFQFSDEALQAAGIQFTHPVILQREQELETRAKMVEYKAISIGRVDILPIQQELADLKRQFDETRTVLSMSSI